MKGPVLFSTVAIAAFAAADASLRDDGTSPAIFSGLKLGMSDTAALETLRPIDPGAFSGVLCNGKSGIGAFVKHLGFGWRLMAISPGRKVTSLEFYRNSRKRTATRQECRSVFENRVFGHYSRKHEGLRWTVETGDSGPLNMKANGNLPGGLMLTLQAKRPEKKRALCEFTVSYSLKTRPGN